MKFIYAQWLWGLLSLPALLALALWDDRKRKRHFAAFAEPALWSELAPEYASHARMRKSVVLLLALGFVLVALARPQWGQHEESVRVTGLDIAIALDVSRSMEVEDVVPSRLDKAKHVIRSILERLHGDRVALAGFAGGAYLACPLTTDLNYVMESLAILRPEMMPVQGTDIALGLETAAKALGRAAEEAAPAAAAGSPPPSKALILISDGENHDDNALEEAARLKEDGIKLYVFGLGTQKGGPIPVRDEHGNLQGYKKDSRGQPIVSRFEPDTLTAIAGAGEGRYWNVSESEGEVAEMLEELGVLHRTDYAERTYLVYEERFQIPLAIAVLLLILELSLPARRILSGLAAFAALVSGFAGFVPEAHALPVESYIQNKKGIEAYRKGDLEASKNHFGKAQALDPELPELEYNRGLVQARQGDFEGAENSFRESARRADERGDDSLKASSMFNLGSTLAKKGDTKGAVRSYLQALDLARKAKNPEMEKGAQKNLELLASEKQKQKQEGKGQKKDQKQGSNDPNHQKDQPDKKDQKDKQAAQEKKFEDPKEARKRFKSQKLTPDDAERVMAELSNKEKELRERLNRRRANEPHSNQVMDW